ncbi:MAG TPA: hypothetical protein VFI18_13190 [Gaiellales bacterium]|nr:hypothetical protein [Gaiellales bacterium]
MYETTDEWSLEGFRGKFHQLLYGEVETTDRMDKMVAELPGLPRGAPHRDRRQGVRELMDAELGYGRGRASGGGCRTRTTR